MNDEIPEEVLRAYSEQCGDIFERRSNNMRKLYETRVRAQRIDLFNDSIYIPVPETTLVEKPQPFYGGPSDAMLGLHFFQQMVPIHPAEKISTALSATSMENLEKQFNWRLAETRKDRISAAFAYWDLPTMPNSLYKRAVCFEHTTATEPEIVQVAHDLSDFPDFLDISIRYPFEQKFFDLLMVVLVVIEYGVIAWIIT